MSGDMVDRYISTTLALIRLKVSEKMCVFYGRTDGRTDDGSPRHGIISVDIAKQS